MMLLGRAPRPLSAREIERLDLRPREVEVLALIAAGCSTAEVAAALYLSVNSVKTHTQALFKKLGVTTRLQAAVWVWSRPDEPEAQSGTVTVTSTSWTGPPHRRAQNSTVTSLGPPSV